MVDELDKALESAKSLDLTVDSEAWERYQAEAEELFKDAKAWAESMEFSDALKYGNEGCE